MFTKRMFQVRAKCFHTLDAFVRLIALLVKHSGDQQNTITKVNLLNKVSWYKWKYRLILNLALLLITKSIIVRFLALWLVSSSLIMM